MLSGSVSFTTKVYNTLNTEKPMSPQDAGERGRRKIKIRNKIELPGTDFLLWKTKKRPGSSYLVRLSRMKSV